MNSPKSFREEELFSAACDLPVAEREVYLARECAEDPAARRRIEILVRAHDEARSFMGSPPEGRLAEELANRAPGGADAAAGDRVGRYKLLQKIGEGGCGVVFLAEQEQP